MAVITWMGLAWGVSMALGSVEPGRSYGDRACASTREYIAALEFLRGAKQLQLPELEARLIAEEVSRSCTGAARRFVSVAQTLLKAGLSGKDALAQAREFAARSEGEARGFVGVFRLAFLEEGLDLDLMSSIRLARELSVQFVGESAWAYEDFRKIVELCVSERGVDLPKATCAELAARIAKKSEIANGGVAADFKKVFRFATDPKRGPGVTTAKALLLAEEIAVAGPDAAENFIGAFRYATKENGLAMPADEAFFFARKMALTTPIKKKK